MAMLRRLPLFVILGFLVGLGSPLAALGQSIDDSIQVLKVTEDDTGLLSIEIALPGSVEAFSPTQQDFVLAENDTVKSLQVFELNQAVDIVIAIDTSGSMANGRLDAAKAAASSFVDGIAPNARFAVVGFDDDATPLIELTDDRSAVQEAIASLEVAGTETVLWDGMANSASLISQSTSERPYVVLLADGEDTASTATQADAIAQLRASQAGLYVVAIDSPLADHGALRTAVNQVGGQYIDGADDANLGAIYQEVAARLSSRYILTYNSTPGLQREVRFTVLVNDRILPGGFTIEGETAAAPDQPAAPSAPSRTGTVTAAPLSTVVIEGPGFLGTTAGLYLGAGSAFIALFVGILILAFPATRSQFATTTSSIDRVAGMRGQISDFAERLVAGSSGSGRIERMLDLGGVNLRVGEFLSIVAAVGVVLFILLTGLANPILGLLGAALAVAGGFMYLDSIVRRRRQRFTEQLTDALQVLHSSLKAGRSLPQAIEYVASETPAPISDEFRRIVFEVRVGRDMTEAMLSVAERMDSPDFAWIAQAVDINRAVGGNLTEVLDNVSATIRERARIGRQIRSLSSEGRATAWVLLVMPPIIAVFLIWRTPENMQRFAESSTGRLLLAGAALGMVTGILWIRSLVKIKF